MSIEYADARAFVGQVIHVKIDRPLGSRHPEWGFIYPVNYGFVPGASIFHQIPFELTEHIVL